MLSLSVDQVVDQCFQVSLKHAASWMSAALVPWVAEVLCAQYERYKRMGFQDMSKE